jgi:hypothetical protein
MDEIRIEARNPLERILEVIKEVKPIAISEETGTHGTCVLIPAAELREDCGRTRAGARQLLQ